MPTPDDERTVSALLQLYDEALPHVYGYLVRRCDDPATAEDLTADTFMAAVDAHRRGTEIGVPWLIGTARHKLVDHWRRIGRQREAMEELWAAADPPAGSDDPVDALHVRETMARLTPHHRLALTLRYLDGLPVVQVASHLSRSLHATESLLVRARAAYRQAAADLEGGEP
ncbi:MAG: sigma-70 family RNA polymerase sigma factor [Acidimicrobiaceae bacterium]|nr:sigma-70 family RNA polymerase sigma factor [Acidimicrobiaceae bacterium]